MVFKVTSERDLPGSFYKEKREQDLWGAPASHGKGKGGGARSRGGGLRASSHPGGETQGAPSSWGPRVGR